MKKAKRKTGIRSKKRGARRFALPAVLLCAALIALFFGWMNLQARIVHLRMANVYLPDLPAAFDGVRALYISDMNVRSARDFAAVAQAAAELDPEILLLGGDYAHCADCAAEAGEAIAMLGPVSAPLGKFAVCGEGDADIDYAAAFAAAGIRPLSDSCATVERGGAQIVIAGLNGGAGAQTRFDDIGRYFSGGECVLVLAHNPSAYVGVRVAEARNGGPWADLVLSGHNLGGQIVLLGRTMRSIPEAEARTLGGWYYADDLPMLASSGLGCRGPMLRLGSESEIWLLTLRRPELQGAPALP